MDTAGDPTWLHPVDDHVVPFQVYAHPFEPSATQKTAVGQETATKSPPAFVAGSGLLQGEIAGALGEREAVSDVCGAAADRMIAGHQHGEEDPRACHVEAQATPTYAR